MDVLGERSQESTSLFEPSGNETPMIVGATRRHLIKPVTRSFSLRVTCIHALRKILTPVSLDFLYSRPTRPQRAAEKFGSSGLVRFLHNHQAQRDRCWPSGTRAKTSEQEPSFNSPNVVCAVAGTFSGWNPPTMNSEANSIHSTATASVASLSHGGDAKFICALGALTSQV